VRGCWDEELKIALLMARQYRNKLYSVGEQDVLTCALNTAFELGLNETFAPMLRTGSMQMGVNTSASDFLTWHARAGTDDPLTSPQLPASACDDNIGAGTPGGYLPSMQIKVISFYAMLSIILRYA
jgi:hypothetical protein